MKLLRLDAQHYRSLFDVSLEFSDLNLFIGANAAGKSTVLDALRFLHEGVQARDFRTPVFSRGGIIHLAWKGQEAERIRLSVRLEDAGKTWEWTVRLSRVGYEFHVEERIEELYANSPPSQVLDSNKGGGWWWSGTENRRITLKQAPTACALTAAATDASFPARDIADFVSRWGFFDPNPFLLRHDWTGLDAGRFDPYGRNLAETLYTLQASSPDVVKRICSATRAIVGLPSEIEPRESEGRFYFVQSEPGLQFTVHQMGVSSGTLRMLALMTALFGQPEADLMGIEEPENYVHPTALSSFVEHLLNARGGTFVLAMSHDMNGFRIVQEVEQQRRMGCDQELDATVLHLQDQGVTVDEVRIPPGNGALNVSMAERIIKAAWHESVGSSAPDKFVILVDLDKKTANEVLAPLQEQLPGRIPDDVRATIKYAYAEQTLEAWYFADATNLKDYLGHAPGHVDTSKPDENREPQGPPETCAW